MIELTIKTAEGYFCGWKRMRGKAWRGPEFSHIPIHTFDPSNTIGEPWLAIKENLETRGYDAKIVEVEWKAGQYVEVEP